MTTSQRIIHALRAWRRASTGAIAVEFALITPILTIAMIALADYGQMVYHNTRVSDAASAGVKFALIQGNSENDAGIQAAIQASLIDPDAATITISRACRCVTGGVVSCDTECDDEISPGRYLEIIVETPYEMLLDYPHLDDVGTLRSQAVTRIPDA